MREQRESTQTVNKSNDSAHDDQASRLRAMMRDVVHEAHEDLPVATEHPPSTPVPPASQPVQVEQKPRKRPRIVTIASG